MSDINPIEVTQKVSDPQILFIEQIFESEDSYGAQYSLFCNEQLLCDLIEFDKSQNQYIRFYHGTKREITRTEMTLAFNWFKEQVLWATTQDVINNHIKKYKNIYEFLTHTASIEVSNSGTLVDIKEYNNEL